MQPRAETKLVWAMPRPRKGRMKSNYIIACLLGGKSARLCRFHKVKRLKELVIIDGLQRSIDLQAKNEIKSKIMYDN